jgi:hypothetical protein
MDFEQLFFRQIWIELGIDDALFVQNLELFDRRKIDRAAAGRWLGDAAARSASGQSPGAAVGLALGCSGSG